MYSGPCSSTPPFFITSFAYASKLTFPSDTGSRIKVAYGTRPYTVL